MPDFSNLLTLLGMNQPAEASTGNGLRETMGINLPVQAQAPVPKPKGPLDKKQKPAPRKVEAQAPPSPASVQTSPKSDAQIAFANAAGMMDSLTPEQQKRFETIQNDKQFITPTSEQVANAGNNAVELNKILNPNQDENSRLIQEAIRPLLDKMSEARKNPYKDINFENIDKILAYNQNRKPIGIKNADGEENYSLPLIKVIEEKNKIDNEATRNQFGAVKDQLVPGAMSSYAIKPGQRPPNSQGLEKSVQKYGEIMKNAKSFGDTVNNIKGAFNEAGSDISVPNLALFLKQTAEPTVWGSVKSYTIGHDPKIVSVGTAVIDAIIDYTKEVSGTRPSAQSVARDLLRAGITEGSSLEQVKENLGSLLGRMKDQSLAKSAGYSSAVKSQYNQNFGQNVEGNLRGVDTNLSGTGAQKPAAPTRPTLRGNY